MKFTRMIKFLQISLKPALFALGLCFAIVHSIHAQSNSQYDVAAIVWPSYHPDDRAKIFWPDGIGEWQTVASNKPKFEGHEQPRYPLWGYVNEADPYIAQMEINAAVDHGINVFIFDWYWYDGMPYLEGHLNAGFLKAQNNDRMKFYLMWANHDVGLGWDKRNADDAFNRRNTAKVWDGAVDRAEFEKICHRFIEKYFRHPSYYLIDGKPVFMLYRIDRFIDGLGGVKEARDALDWFRKEVKKAGFPGLEIQYSMRREGDRLWTTSEGKEIGVERDLIDQLGINSLTHYVIAHMTDVDRDYKEVTMDTEAMWYRISDSFRADYYPQVSVGWDASPRSYNYTGDIVKNNTPENFRKALEKGKKYLDEHPEQAPLIVINSWNEWTETSYLMPCTMFGYGYLEAVKAVFRDKE